MTDLRQAAQQALEYMKFIGKMDMHPEKWAIIGRLEAALAEPVQQGCDHCNHPLYAATKCRVCGRVTKAVQEPVAWIHTDPDRPRVKFLEWRENEPGYRGDWIKTPLYTAPPQRLPLTSDKDRPDQGATYVEGYGYVDTRAVRAIERAHGIGVQP